MCVCVCRPLTQLTTKRCQCCVASAQANQSKTRGSSAQMRHAQGPRSLFKALADRSPGFEPAPFDDKQGRCARASKGLQKLWLLLDCSTQTRLEQGRC